MRNIGAVVLAAGGSSRLGQPKQLLEFRGETLIRRTVRAASEAGCDPIVVVVGENREAIELALDMRDSRRPTIIENADWRHGVGTSIRLGIQQLPNFVEAAVLLTCDQPYLDASIVAGLIAALAETGRPIVASSYADTLGVPALFHRSCFDALLALPEDTGAKTFILSRQPEVAQIPFARGEIDIDTPEDFERLNENRG